jgi:hypothetical protein
MKQKLLLLYIASCFFACKPEPTPDQYNYNYLTAEQLAKTPYFTNPAFDTLTYVSNQNDTVVFAKTRVDSGWYKTIDASPGNNYTVYHYYQQLTAKYQTIKGEGSFEVVHSKRGNAFKTIALDLLKISFDKYNFYIQDQFLGINHKSIIDSVNIDGKTYFQVTEVFKDLQDSTKSRMFINKSFGAFYIIDLINNISYNSKH